MAYLFGTTITRFFTVGAQLFASLRLLDLPTPWSKIIAFALLQTTSRSLFAYILPSVELRFIFLSLTTLIYFMWLFGANLFPDALFCYITPLALTAVGELVFPPLFMAIEPYLPHSPISSYLLGPGYSYTAYLPSLILVVYFVIRGACGKELTAKRTILFRYAAWLGTFVIVPTICYLRTPDIASLFPNQSPYLGVFFKAYIISLPALGYTLYQYDNKERKNGKLLHYLQRRRVVQDAALRTLREERHDLLNELTLISTYVQMGKTEEALTSISYSAAKLSDRYNYASLPTDAWTTVLELKQIEAERRQIYFHVDLQIDPPQSFTEQRLLPKIIMNLVDNAFAAVTKQPDPQVSLTWQINVQGERQLTVTNNGPEINPWDGKKIFRGGVTSKKDPSGNHGWGLAICRQIARELGASLRYTSSPEITSFIFTLPITSLQDDEHLHAN